ncbi:MAG: response regulator [Actinomycetota bacterium]
MQPTLEPVPTILTVDDCTITQKVIKQVFGKDYRVLGASNAMEALITIYQESIDILVLDVSMPDIDGLELCRTVRKLPRFEEIPIVMLTSRDRPFDKVQGLRAGATEYLTKPVDVERLRQVVTRFLSKSH